VKNDVKQNIFQLGKEGILIPTCPFCYMFLSIEEAENEICENCESKLDVEDIPWVHSDTFPKA
jgi:hypothetical protein